MDPKNLAGSLKVAILVQSLDRESAKMILNGLGKQERDLVISHLAEMGTISAELAETVAALELEIAERKQAQVALAQARDQALTALQLKTQILANVSHDARTPLNIISLNAQYLQRYDESGKKRTRNYALL